MRVVDVCEVSDNTLTVILIPLLVGIGLAIYPICVWAASTKIIIDFSDRQLVIKDKKGSVLDVIKLGLITSCNTEYANRIGPALIIVHATGKGDIFIYRNIAWVKNAPDFYELANRLKEVADSNPQSAAITDTIHESVARHYNPQPNAVHLQNEPVICKARSVNTGMFWAGIIMSLVNIFFVLVLALVIATENEDLGWLALVAAVVEIVWVHRYFLMRTVDVVIYPDRVVFREKRRYNVQNYGTEEKEFLFKNITAFEVRGINGESRVKIVDNTGRQYRFKEHFPWLARINYTQYYSENTLRHAFSCYIKENDTGIRINNIKSKSGNG